MVLSLILHCKDDWTHYDVINTPPLIKQLKPKISKLFYVAQKLPHHHQTRVPPMSRFKSSRGGLEVEQWSDNRTLSILVGSIPAWGMHDYMVPMDLLLCTSWMCVICVCKLKDYN